MRVPMLLLSAVCDFVELGLCGLASVFESRSRYFSVAWGNLLNLMFFRLIIKYALYTMSFLTNRVVAITFCLEEQLSSVLLFLCLSWGTLLQVCCSAFDLLVGITVKAGFTP